MERILSSGRKIESASPSSSSSSSSVNRVLKSGRQLSSNESVHKKQRTLYSQIGTILHENDDNNHHQELSSRIQISERKPRENEPTKKLLLQAVSDANKSVLMKLNKSNGIVKVMKPDGTTECLTTKSLAKRLKAKEPTWVDPTSLINKAEPSIGKMKIRIRNEYCETNDGDDDENKKSNEEHLSSMEFEDDDEDEFIVVVNNDDDINNIWMLNDYPYDDHDDGQKTESFKRKLSDDMMSDDNDQQQQQQQEYSPQTNQGKKLKRCRFWPDCHNGEQCEFVHPTQRCIHFPNCAYGAECLYIHPPCRFAGACTRTDCPYLHSTSTPASSPSSTNNNTTRSSITNRPESSTVCKFGVQCMRPNCMYSHPRMSYPTARNYKWVNNKWRASDDISLLPPTPKNLVYENPFINDKTSINKTLNSNDDSIEN